jgi:dihydrofolate reductase
MVGAPMRKVLLQMCITLDGFADGETRIVPEFDTPFGAELEEELAKTDAASVDTLLLGRGTYEEFANFWPTAGSDPAASADFLESARFLNETPKVVFSKSPLKVDWKPSRIVTGDLATEIARLKGLPGKNMMILGGVRFPRAMIEQDLVDEYLLTVVPMIMGKGDDRLFGDHPNAKNLVLVRSRAFSNGAVFQHYRTGR